MRTFKEEPRKEVASQVAHLVKTPPADARDARDVRSPGQVDPLEIGDDTRLKHACLENP